MEPQKKYLYGASIQGIQKFIFETSKLREIAGASEIIEQLCDQKNFIDKLGLNAGDLQFIRSAAGSISLICSVKDTVEKIVRNWPKTVAEMAPGANLSQAVVEIASSPTMDDMNHLERKLRTARNKKSVPAELGSLAVVRSRRTGKPAVDWKDNPSSATSSHAPRSLASRKKQQAGGESAANSLMQKCLPDSFEKSVSAYPFDVSDIVRDEESSWIAVVHADGNGLGKIIQKLLLQFPENDGRIGSVMKEFSNQLNRSTIHSVKTAIESLQLAENRYGPGRRRYPFRPVLVGGDDITIILRADLALGFTEQFLKSFEIATANNLNKMGEQRGTDIFKHGLTACAGIAYMKATYPFHYGIDLAEQLCTEAKKVSKAQGERACSSLLFHKIQDSFIADYQDIVKRELQPQKNICFQYGPYTPDSDDSPLPSISELRDRAKCLGTKDAPKSGIRKWLTMLFEDESRADFWMQRVCEITSEKYVRELALKPAVKDGKTHLFDLVTIESISSSEE